MDVSIPITIILSPNDLNTPILRTQIVRLYLKSKTQLYVAYKQEKSLLLTKRFKQFKSRRMGKIYHVNTNQKKSWSGYTNIRESRFQSNEYKQIKKVITQ